jgi:hypothetical protein
MFISKLSPSRVGANTEPKDPRLPRGKDFNGIPFDGLRYRRVLGDLFINGCAPTDVVQGRLGDCFFLSSLAALAKTHPDLLMRAVRRNRNDDTYRVTLYQKKRGVLKRVGIQVPPTFPAQSDGRQVFARGLRNNRRGLEKWPAVFEKAYADFRGGFTVINQGGFSDEAMMTLTGKPATTYLLSSAQSGPKLWKKMKTWAAQRRPMVTATPSKAQLVRLTGRADMAGLLEGHAYAVLGVSEKNGVGSVTLYTPLAPVDGDNPAGGTQRTWTLTFDEYRKLFEDLTVGSV